MKLGRLFEKFGGQAGPQGPLARPPVLSAPLRVPRGPFRFKITTHRGALYEIRVSRDLQNWIPLVKNIARDAGIEYLDSEAAKLGHRFYRVLADGVPSAVAIGYASTTLPPGFSMIANPFNAPNNRVAALFRDWPDGTTVNKFDTRLFRLTDNGIKNKAWANPHEKLVPGEGAIFFNPTADYRSLTFVGEVVQGNLSLPIPAGFSVSSSLIPQPGQLHEDLAFPIAEGDVIHLFDRDKKKYILHPYENGKWTHGSPVVGIAESFWVAKTSASTWERNFTMPV